MKFRNLALAICAVAIGAWLTTWWVHRPEKLTQEFASHLFHERYEEGALMLQAPSSIVVSPDGELVLVDHTGDATTVPVAKLPFKVGGGKSDRPSDFSMIALGKSTNGVLNTPPVIIYLSIDGGKVRIDGVES